MIYLKMFIKSSWNLLINPVIIIWFDALHNQFYKRFADGFKWRNLSFVSSLKINGLHPNLYKPISFSLIINGHQRQNFYKPLYSCEEEVKILISGIWLLSPNVVHTIKTIAWNNIKISIWTFLSVWYSKSKKNNICKNIPFFY